MKGLHELHKVLNKVKPDVVKIAKAYYEEAYEMVGENIEAEYEYKYWMGFLEELIHNVALIEDGDFGTLQQFQERACVALYHMGKHNNGPDVQGHINMLHLIKDFIPMEG